MFAKLKNIFKAYFGAGLLVLGPLAISIWIAKTVVETADEALQTARWMPVHIPGLGFAVAIVAILFAGFLGRNVLGKWIFLSAGEVLAKVPVVGAIYSSSRQVFETLLGGHQKSFGRVVVVSFPQGSTLALAFVTSETAPPEIQKLYEEPLLSVYVPTTPNPTSGFYLYVPKSQAKPTNLSVDEALKVIVSLGLVRGHGN